MVKKILLYILSLVMISNLCSCSKDLNIQIEKCVLVSEYDKNTTIDQMRTIKFGSYYQKNISIKEPIEWIVLDKQDGKALLLSKYILDCKCYNNDNIETAWEKSSLRYWLNNEFYNIAFSNEEQNKIQITNVINNNNIDYGTFGGNNTYDKIFCLSIDETRKYFGNGTKGQYGYIIGKKIATRGTNYAKKVDNGGENIYISDLVGNWCIGNSEYWLRSPGNTEWKAALVSIQGYVGSTGNDVGNFVTGVRPAMWVSY